MHQLVEIDLQQALAHRFRAHRGFKAVCAILFNRVVIFRLGHDLHVLQTRIQRIGHDVVFVVEHAFEVIGGLVQHQADAARAALEEPDVRDRHSQFDMAHALTTHAGDRHFDAATIAHNALVLDALVLAAGTLPVAGWTEDLFAEKTVALRTVGTVVDGLRIAHFAVTPRTNGFRGCQCNTHGIVMDA